MIKSRFFYFFVFSVIAFSSPAFGQWKTQNVTLQPGWNAVFLEVQPQPDESDAVFEGIPVESVWAWNRRFSSVQFIKDADTLMPEQPEWLHYFPPDSNKAFLTNLFIIHGGRSYLIKLGGTESVSWSVTGKAVASSGDWIADSFNLTGFYVDPTSPPTFKKYFAPSPAHAGQSVYKLSASGQWVKIAALDTEKINKGEAYWVYCKGQSNYPGPLFVEFEQGYGIDFGRILNEQRLLVKNYTNVNKQISIKVAGDVPLSYWRIAPKPNLSRWTDLTTPLQFKVPASGEVSIRLAVRRKDMPLASKPNSLYKSLLLISDGAGIKLSVQVTARGMLSAGETSLSAMSTTQVTPNKWAGLWVGTASVNKVSYPADPGGVNPPRPYTPVETATEFPMRLIIHVDSEGKARLLQQAILMRKDGKLGQDGTVVEPGRNVILTTDKPDIINRFSGTAVIDGVQVGRRVSSVFFSHKTPNLSSVGQFGETGQTAALSFTIVLDANDPMNPFKHKYHPAHDNLKADFTTIQDEGEESFTVKRFINLEFSDTAPDRLDIAGWGDNQVGGTYKETIRGIYNKLNSDGTTVKDLKVQGYFRLHRVIDVPVLNDGLLVNN